MRQEKIQIYFLRTCLKDVFEGNCVHIKANQDVKDGLSAFFFPGCHAREIGGFSDRFSQVYIQQVVFYQFPKLHLTDVAVTGNVNIQFGQRLCQLGTRCICLPIQTFLEGMHGLCDIVQKAGGIGEKEGFIVRMPVIPFLVVSTLQFSLSILDGLQCPKERIDFCHKSGIQVILRCQCIARCTAITAQCFQEDLATGGGYHAGDFVNEQAQLVSLGSRSELIHLHEERRIIHPVILLVSCRCRS